MSIGTVTVVKKAASVGPVNFDVVQFAGDANYPTGGSVCGPAIAAALGKGNIDAFAVIGQDCGGYSVAWDEANSKLKVFRTAAINAPDEEVPNTTNLSAVVFHVLVISK